MRARKHLVIKNKKLITIVSAILILLGNCTHIYGDVCDVIRNYGNTVIPVQENRIRMIKEKVTIDESADIDNRGGKTQAIFILENTTDKEINLEMGFPITKEILNKLPPLSGHCYTFTTKIDGKEIPITIKKVISNTKLKIGTQYHYMYTWPVSFKPKEKKTIECMYDCVIGGNCKKGEIGGGINYITKTGALWKGSIGQADFYVIFGASIFDKRTRTIINPKGYKIINNKVIEWHFRNWKPTKDIRIEFYENYKKQSK